MSDQDHSEYLAARAIAERHMSRTARDPRAAAVHAELSARYEALAADPSLELPAFEVREFEPPALQSPEVDLLPLDFTPVEMRATDTPHLRDAAG